MKRALIGGLVLVAACSEGEQPAPKASAATALQAGGWEITTETTQLRSTDNTTPAVKTKVGDRVTANICLAEADVRRPQPAFFGAADSDNCTADSYYVSNGRLNVSGLCRPEGMGGEVGVVVNGTFTATTFEAEERANSVLSGAGDFQMTRKVTGRHVGECPPDASAGAKG